MYRFSENRGELKIWENWKFFGKIAKRFRDCEIL